MNKTEIQFEIDTGVAVTIIGKLDYLNYFKNVKLKTTNLILKFHCESILELLVCINVQV